MSIFTNSVGKKYINNIGAIQYNTDTCFIQPIQYNLRYLDNAYLHSIYVALCLDEFEKIRRCYFATFRTVNVYSIGKLLFFVYYDGLAESMCDNVTFIDVCEIIQDESSVYAFDVENIFYTIDKIRRSYKNLDSANGRDILKRLYDKRPDLIAYGSWKYTDYGIVITGVRQQPEGHMMPLPKERRFDIGLNNTNVPIAVTANGVDDTDIVKRYSTELSANFFLFYYRYSHEQQLWNYRQLINFLNNYNIRVTYTDYSNVSPNRSTCLNNSNICDISALIKRRRNKYTCRR